jgi:Lower baseplate protein N-terminal domain
MEETMFDAVRRPLGRLFYWVVAMATIVSYGRIAYAAEPVPQSGPPTTIVADTVYLADGTTAEGTLIITWPAFVTTSGAAVAGGASNVTLGANGALSVALVVNAGATPAGMYYTVVYQIGPGEVKTEYWVVPTTSPATLAQVRTTPGSSVAAAPVSVQYVNSQLATVVHLAGTETITGTKTFSSPPTVPTPTATGEVANKDYVDQSVTNIGAGIFLPTAGGTMSGPITLPGDVATLVAPPTVLFDGVIASAPTFCKYALVDATNMQCTIAYTYVTHISLAEVRTALPSSSYVTQLVETLSNGGECEIASSTTLDFYPEYVQALNTLIVASYRSSGRAVAEVVNSASVTSLMNGADNGVRGIVRTMKTPSARTQADCENVAMAILDDAGGLAWTGTYRTWSDFLPGAAVDIFPGDGLAVNAPSRDGVFNAIVRAVSIDLVDPADDRGMYTIEFANDLAVPLALQDQSSATTIPLQDMPAQLATTQVGSYYLSNLTDAQITAVTSTTVTVDAGMSPGSGFGIEVRLHDFGWGAANDRNLLGRFTSETFSLPRLARTQNYFLRLYDSSSPPKYSRYAAALHVDYPL